MLPIVEVVGPCHTQPYLEIAQGLVVTGLKSEYHARVGDGGSQFMGILCIFIIIGKAELVLGRKREGDFLTAIKAERGRIDAHGGEVATHGTSGVAHGHASGGTLVIGLRVKNRIIEALSMKYQRKQR